MNFSRKQGFLEFPGEEASLRRVRKAQIKPFVAGGLNNLDLDAQLSVRGPEFFGYDPGLSERQIAPAASENNAVHEFQRFTPKTTCTQKPSLEPTVAPGDRCNPQSDRPGDWNTPLGTKLMMMAQPGNKRSHVVGNHLFATDYLAAPHLQRLPDDALQRIDIVEKNSL